MQSDEAIGWESRDPCIWSRLRYSTEPYTHRDQAARQTRECDSCLDFRNRIPKWGNRTEVMILL